MHSFAKVDGLANRDEVRRSKREAILQKSLVSPFAEIPKRRNGAPPSQLPVLESP